MSAMTRDAGDFATHCLCTLSQDPTPYKAFVENKHQSAIRKDCRKAVEFLFSRFFESQLRLIKTLSSCPFLPNPNGINIHCRKPDSHRLRDQAEGRNPKMQRPDFSSRVKIKTKTKLWTTAALGCGFASNLLWGSRPALNLPNGHPSCDSCAYDAHVAQPPPTVSFTLQYGYQSPQTKDEPILP
jgi:hypothetical protein